MLPRSPSWSIVRLLTSGHLEGKACPLQSLPPTTCLPIHSGEDDMVSPHSSECSSSIRGSNSLLLCGYNLDRSSMHGEGVTAVAWRTSAWHHCMSSRRAFAATSRALKIKQRREALAARVKIPRWAPPEAVSYTHLTLPTIYSV